MDHINEKASSKMLPEMAQTCWDMCLMLSSNHGFAKITCCTGICIPCGYVMK